VEYGTLDKNMFRLQNQQ